MYLEKAVIESDIKRANLGLLLAFVLSMTCIVASAYSAATGHEATAAVLGGGSLASLAGTFIYGSTTRQEERAEKRKMLLDTRSQGDDEKLEK